MRLYIAATHRTAMPNSSACPDGAPGAAMGIFSVAASAASKDAQHRLSGPDSLFHHSSLRTRHKGNFDKSPQNVAAVAPQHGKHSQL
jgi:hypothetical protein